MGCRERTACTRLQRATSLYVQKEVFASPPPAIEGYICRWVAGQSPPNAATLAGKLKHRTTLPPQLIKVWALTERGRSLGAKTATTRTRGQISHDLGVTEMICHIAKQSSQLALRIRDEHVFSRYPLTDQFGQRKNPDAAIVDPESESIEAILEFGGRSYDKRRCQSFIDAMERLPSGNITCYVY